MSDDDLPSEAEVLRSMHDLLDGIVQIAENHGFERGDDLQRWLARSLPRASDVLDVKSSEIAVAVGTPVAKHTGYGFPGEVRAAFRTTEGKLRYVVEATGPGYAGMLHIFSPEQIVVQQGRTHGQREADGNKPS